MQCSVNGVRPHLFCVLVAGLAACAAAPALAQSTNSPRLEQLRIIAPAAPGGGWDQTARVMQIALQQAGIVRTAPVENIPGAAGTIGLARFIGAERGNGDAVLVSGLIMLGGIVTNQSPVSLGDATPLARLTGEYEAIVVPAASPYQSLRELLTAFKERPEAISWGGGSAGGSDQILAGLIAEAVGVSPARVNYIALLRRRRVAVGHRRRPGVGGDQRARGAGGADRGGHGAGAGHLERRAASRS